MSLETDLDACNPPIPQSPDHSLSGTPIPTQMLITEEEPPNPPSPLASALSDLTEPQIHNFWVTAWLNDARTADLTIVADQAELAAFKVTGLATTCRAIKGSDMSSLYTDDDLWFKVTLAYPPEAASLLLASPMVESDQSVVLFTSFPCSCDWILAEDVDIMLEEVRNAPLDTLPPFEAFSIVPGGRPYTWSRKLGRSISSIESRRVQSPAKQLYE